VHEDSRPRKGRGLAATGRACHLTAPVHGNYAGPTPLVRCCGPIPSQLSHTRRSTCCLHQTGGLVSCLCGPWLEWEGGRPGLDEQRKSGLGVPVAYAVQRTEDGGLCRHFSSLADGCISGLPSAWGFARRQGHRQAALGLALSAVRGNWNTVLAVDGGRVDGRRCNYPPRTVIRPRPRVGPAAGGWRVAPVYRAPCTSNYAVRCRLLVTAESPERAGPGPAWQACLRHAAAFGRCLATHLGNTGVLHGHAPGPTTQEPLPSIATPTAATRLREKRAPLPK